MDGAQVVESVATNDPHALLSIFGLPIIFCIVFAVMMIYKHLVKGKNEMWTSLIPVWAGLLGMILEVYFFYKFPQLIMVDDVVSAIIVGFTTGLSAVGIHQIGKQFSKNGNTNENLYNVLTGTNSASEENKSETTAPAKTISATQSVKLPDQVVTIPGETVQVRQSYTKVE